MSLTSCSNLSGTGSLGVRNLVVVGVVSIIGVIVAGPA